jgi:hypothetical protein
MGKLGLASKRKRVTLTVPQKLEIIGRLESDKSQKEVVASYNTESSTINDIKEWTNQLLSFMASNETVNWHNWTRCCVRSLQQ